jgi:hypothetical protein
MQPIPPILPPIPGNPVVLEDVISAIAYRKNVSKRREINQEAVPNAEIVQAMIAERQVSYFLSFFFYCRCYFLPFYLLCLTFHSSFHFLYQHQIFERFAGNEMAPNWFAPAMAQAMTPVVQQYQQMQGSLNQMQESLNVFNLQSMIAFNRSVMHPSFPYHI